MTTPDRLDDYFADLRAQQRVEPQTPSHDVLEALARGELDEKSAELLHDRLLTDPAARRRYRQVLAAIAAAEELNASAPASGEAPSSAVPSSATTPSLAEARSRRRVAVWVGIAAIAAAVLFLCRDLVRPSKAISLQPRACLAIANMAVKGSGEAGLGPALRVRSSDSLSISNDTFAGESKFVVLALDGGGSTESTRSGPSVPARELFNERTGRFVVLFAPVANAVDLAATRTRVEKRLSSVAAGASISEVHDQLAREFGFGEGEVCVLISAIEVLP